MTLNKAVPLIALQEWGPRSAWYFQTQLGEEWEYFASGSEDPVAIFWDTKVAWRPG